MENNNAGSTSNNNIHGLKISDSIIGFVIVQLKERPYGQYAVLKSPEFFEKYNLLGETLELVGKEDIIDFVSARKENVKHFNNFVKNYEEKTKSRGKSS